MPGQVSMREKGLSQGSELGILTNPSAKYCDPLSIRLERFAKILQQIFNVRPSSETPKNVATASVGEGWAKEGPVLSEERS